MKPAAALIAVFAALYWQIVAETVDRGPPEPWRPGMATSLR